MKFLNKVVILCLISFSLNAQIVRMETVLGNIDIELRPDVAPVTVANFLNYVNSGDYDNSIIHRIGRGNSGLTFIVQGGGYNVVNEAAVAIPSRGAIVNEFNLSNVRGTIAMAKIGGNPNSATSQWFFNNVDNQFLDSQNGGFTVFGTVIAGMDVVDAIALVQRVNLNNFFPEIPLLNYTFPNTVSLENFVLITHASILQDRIINPGLNGSWYNAATSGQGFFFDYFTSIDKMFMGWFTFDTVELNAGVAANLGDANQRWLTGLGNINHETNAISFDIISTSGGLFDNPQTVTNSDAGSVGTVTITFTDCANATVDYNLTSPAVSGSFPITRIVNDNVALCESLSRQVGTSR